MNELGVLESVFVSLMWGFIILLPYAIADFMDARQRKKRGI